MGAWVFDEAERTLTRDGEARQLTPKAAAVLSCLLKREGEIVSRSDILEAVWPGIHVTEDLVREYVHDLRAALDDDAAAPRHIETVRARGFRLIGGIETGAAAAARDDRPTLAILPPHAAGDAVALAESVAAALFAGFAARTDVIIISRRTSFAPDMPTDPRAAAAALGADYLIEMDCAPVKGGTSVAVSLLDDGARTVWGARLTAEDADEDAADRVASAILAALIGWRGELHRAETFAATRADAAKLTAFEHFVRGCDVEERFDAAGLRRALRHLDRSIALDPAFPRAWVMKAIFLQFAYDAEARRDRSVLSESVDCFARAYALNPNDALTLSFMVLQRARGGDMEGALADLARARAGCAADPDAAVCTATALSVVGGETEAALALFDDAMAAERAPPGWTRFVEARLAFFAGAFGRSVAASRAGPQRVSAVVYRGLSGAMLGDAAVMAEAHEELAARYPAFDFGFYADYFPIAAPAARALWDDAVGKFRAQAPRRRGAA